MVMRCITYTRATGRSRRNAINAHYGLPKCFCPTHAAANGATPTGGRFAACTCSGPSGAQVDFDCPHVSSAVNRLLLNPVVGTECALILDARVRAALQIIAPADLAQERDLPAEYVDEPGERVTS